MSYICMVGKKNLVLSYRLEHLLTLNHLDNMYKNHRAVERRLDTQ